MTDSMPITREDLQRTADDVLDRVDQRFADNQRYVDSKHDENLRYRASDRVVLDAILSEQKKTNGRVTKLEGGGLSVAQFSIWIAIIVGTYAVLTVALGFHK